LLELKITSWSGFTEAPIIVALDADARPTDESQADTRPALRLIRGGKSA
jgi:hypothetical protein